MEVVDIAQRLIAGSTLVKQGAEGVGSRFIGTLPITRRLTATRHQRTQRAYRCDLLPSPLMVQSSSRACEDEASRRDPPASITILLKHRFPKQYRHPSLDSQLTRQRLTSEARALVRCIKAGVSVPALRLVDARQGCLGMEWIDGWTVRELLGGGQEDDQVPSTRDDGQASRVGHDLEAMGIDEGESARVPLERSQPLTDDMSRLQTRCSLLSDGRLQRCTSPTSSTAT